MLTLCHNFFNVTPSNKNSKDAGQPYDRKRYMFGLFILFMVDVLWVVSSEMTKYIYTDLKLERPFLVTYVRSSMLFVYLVVLCFSPPTRDPCRPADYTQLLEPTAETDDENFFNEAGNSLGDSIFVPVRAGETTDSDDAAPRAVRFNKVAEVRVMSASQAGEALLARLSWSASIRATEHAQRRAAAAATRRHLRLAVMFALPWFISNYLYRVSLAQSRTSVATVCVSCAGACAAAVGSVCGRTPAPHAPHASHAPHAASRLSLSNVVALLLSGGAVVVVLYAEGAEYTAGLAALGSALCYALHLLIFRQELRRSEGINSPLLAGLVGCGCLCLGWSAGAVLSATGVERAVSPSPNLFAWLLLDAALGPLLFDALWMWGYSLTSPQTASLSLCLCIPLPALLELCRGGAGGAGGAGAGALRAGAAAVATAGSLLAALDPHTSPDLTAWIREKCYWRQGFATIRNIPELDEQSEALMSADEPT